MVVRTHMVGSQRIAFSLLSLHWFSKTWNKYIGMLPKQYISPLSIYIWISVVCISSIFFQSNSTVVSVISTIVKLFSNNDFDITKVKISKLFIFVALILTNPSCFWQHILRSYRSLLFKKTYVLQLQIVPQKLLCY